MDTKAIAKQFHEDGYAIVREVFSKPEIARIEDATHWHTCCIAESDAEAARSATFENARFIQGVYGVEFKDALILLTLIGKLSRSRTQRWGAHGPVVCSSFAKSALREAMRVYRPSCA
jgi:hypothetical protein